MKRQPKVGTCIFCPTYGTLEGEHVFSQWLRDELCIKGDRKQRVILGPQFNIVRSWMKPMSTRRAWCVCPECNHGWMKDLEDDVKLHLAVVARIGTAIVPTGSAARLLAAWALKTAAVSQELPPNTLKPIDSMICDYLRQNGEPPLGTTAWMLPTTEPDMDAIAMLAAFGRGSQELGYTAQVAVGRVRLALILPRGGRELPFQPSRVFGIPPIPLWPVPAGAGLWRPAS
jgi:hypothetical protein